MAVPPSPSPHPFPIPLPRFPSAVTRRPPVADNLPAAICDFYYNRLARNLQPRHRRGRDPTAVGFLFASYYPGLRLLRSVPGFAIVAKMSLKEPR